MGLQYAFFKANTRLVKAAGNSPPLKRAEKGPAVVLLQAGFLDLGYSLPISTKKGGVPDGIYGKETYDVVYQFQKDHKLSKDGVAGKQTITTLDALLVAKTKPIPKPIKPLHPKPLPSTNEYQVGSKDPVLRADKGSGVWNSSPVTNTARAQWALIMGILPGAAAVIGDDAAINMAHYMGNSGKDLTIDLEDMVADVSSAQKRYLAEVKQAKKFVEMLPDGKFGITSKRTNGGYNYKSENWNWFFAVGGYSTWGKGVAEVKTLGKKTMITLEFEYKFYDRYNWDNGKKVTILGVEITDHFMGEFHRQGLAQEFNMYGSFKRKLSWEKGQSIPANQIAVKKSSVKKYGW